MHGERKPLGELVTRVDWNSQSVSE